MYIDPIQREITDQINNTPYMYINAWNGQRIIYELVANYFLMNNPQEMGYQFTQKYNTDPTKSEVYIDVGFRWDANKVNKRPAVFVSRDDVTFTPMRQIGQTYKFNPAESEQYRQHICQLPISISCVGSNLGLAESLADFVKQPFMYYGMEIINDFKLRGLQLQSMSKPRLFPEARDHFIVDLNLLMTYDENWIVKGDDLKLKTISKRIFDSVTGPPLENQ